MPEIDRKQFVAALTQLRHTVAVVDDFPILSCVHFSRAAMTTFDGSVAMRVPLETGCEGSVSFAKLHAWAKKCRGKTLSLELDGHWANFAQPSVGGAKSGLKLGKVANWPLEEWPLFEADKPLPETWFDAFQLADRCRGVDINEPWRLGVTMQRAEGCFRFYATNNVALAVGRADAAGEVIPERIQFPTRLLEAMAGVKEAPHAVVQNDRWIRVTYADGRVLLSLRKATRPAVSRFREVNPPEEWSQPFIPVDDKFGAAVQRVCDVHRAEDRVELAIALAGGELRLDAHSAGAQTTESFAVETEHAAGSVRVNGRVLLSVLDGAHEMRLTGRQLLLRHEHGAVIMATLG